MKRSPVPGYSRRPEPFPQPVLPGAALSIPAGQNKAGTPGTAGTRGTRPSHRNRDPSLFYPKKNTPRGRKVKCWERRARPQRVNGAAARRGAFACHYIMQTYIPALTEQVQNVPLAVVGFGPPARPAPREPTAVPIFLSPFVVSALRVCPV